MAQVPRRHFVQGNRVSSDFESRRPYGAAAIICFLPRTAFADANLSWAILAASLRDANRTQTRDANHTQKGIGLNCRWLPLPYPRFPPDAAPAADRQPRARDPRSARLHHRPLQLQVRLLPHRRSGRAVSGTGHRRISAPDRAFCRPRNHQGAAHRRRAAVAARGGRTGAGAGAPAHAGRRAAGPCAHHQRPSAGVARAARSKRPG